MEHKDIKLALIRSAIHTISSVGIDSATTKLLSTNANVNEVYIYRIFDGKDNLFAEAFNYVDKDFATTLLSFLKKSFNEYIDPEARFKCLFSLIWQYAVADKEKCSFFIRYYYSRCYTHELSLKRKEVYEDFIRIFETAFIRGTDIWWLFNHILDVVFSTAIKVLRDEIPDDSKTEERIYNLLFPAIKQYFKK